MMFSISKLPEEIVDSISSYFIEHKMQQDVSTLLNKNRRSLYFSWYSDWLKNTAEDPMWLQICKYKNNLAFINLVFLQFDYILQKKNKLNATPPTVHLESYYEYANDVYIEAYGKLLPKRDYKRQELITIIKDCEREIQDCLVNNLPLSHNVIKIHI